MLLSLANDSPPDRTESIFRKFAAEEVLASLKALGETPDPGDPLARIGMEFDDAGRSIRNCYGLFSDTWRPERHSEWAAGAAAEAAGFRLGIRRAHRASLRFLIWVAAGSTAAEIGMYAGCGLLRRGPRCYILDSADPAKLKSILEDIERRCGLSVSIALRSALVVGAAEGSEGRVTVLLLEKLANLYDRHKIDSRLHFFALAEEGSLLDRFARERGYRRATPHFEATVPGRQGGPLAWSSLLPLALGGTGLSPWIRNACLNEKDIHTAWRLASFLQAQGEAGRDKVTLLLPKDWRDAALWTKQAFEESLGASERWGIKIIPSSKPRLANYLSPRDPQQDRVFVAVRVSGMPGSEAAKIGLIRRSGYPLSVLTLPRGSQLSRYMQFVHCAVFGLAWLRGLNFAARPGAERHQFITEHILEEAERAGGVTETSCWKVMAASPRQIPFRGELILHFDRLGVKLDPTGMDAPQLYAAALRQLAAERHIAYGHLAFCGDTQYSPRGVALRRVLERAAADVFERRLAMPAEVHEVPAVNHVCAETMLAHGRCFSTLVMSEAQDNLAAARFAPSYHMAQSLATQLALAERGRHVIVLTLRNLEEAALEALAEFFRRAAGCLRPGRY